MDKTLLKAQFTNREVVAATVDGEDDTLVFDSNVLIANLTALLVGFIAVRKIPGAHQTVRGALSKVGLAKAGPQSMDAIA